VTQRLSTETVVDGRYRVLDRVGTGGMADVYCAQDLQLGRKIALKILHPRFAEDAEFVERFRREASSAAGLQHQHVVAIYDRGQYDGTYYIAMEYVDGRSLKSIVQEEGPLDPLRAIDFTVQILRAVRFAHRRGIIHRDLKPHNVLVDDEGRAKVADFGIAKAGASDMTQTGSIMGTAQYLSPEQAQGMDVSAASDLYSVGVILYELLAGRVPFEGESAVAIALKHANEQPVPPSAYNPAVGPALDAVVLRALEKDPARRYHDADEFIQALEAASAATATTAVVAPAPPPPAPPPPAILDEEPERRRRWPWALLLVAVVAAIVAALLLLNNGGADQVTVPRVVGADQASAQAKLRQEGFTTDAVPKTSDRPKGEVIGQDPSGGSQADKGSTVTLTVSDGPAQVRVPPVTGISADAAKSRLKKAGLKPNAHRESSDSVPTGVVISSSPDEGSTVDVGSTVALTVSNGPQQVSVPDVTGKTADDATAELQSAGLQVSRTEQESQDRPAGTVLSQSPAGGTAVNKGATVTLTVAKAPAVVTVPVPDVTGEDEDFAIKKLSSDGFAVDRKTQDVDQPDGDGVVLTQSPSGGKAKKGSTVTITIGHFVGTTTGGTGTTTTPPGTGTGTTGAAPGATGGAGTQTGASTP
jgi:eukaryotic-like serine/threonine-protein kinase